MPGRKSSISRLAEALHVDEHTLTVFLENISPAIDSLIKVLRENKPPKELLEKQVYLQKIDKTVKGHKYTYIQLCVKEYIDGRKKETCIDARSDKKLAYLVIAREAAKIIKYMEKLFLNNPDP